MHTLSLTFLFDASHLVFFHPERIQHKPTLNSEHLLSVISEDNLGKHDLPLAMQGGMAALFACSITKNA